MLAKACYNAKARSEMYEAEEVLVNYLTRHTA
jgi:hypothetical protein